MYGQIVTISLTYPTTLPLKERGLVVKRKDIMNLFELENEEVIKSFNLKEVTDFTLIHDVQVIRGEDYQYVCWIDKKGYGSALTPMGALWFGINQFKKQKMSETNNQLTRQEIARVFAMYWDCPVSWNIPNSDTDIWDIPDADYYQNALSHIKNQIGRDSFRLIYKLALTPLSSITDAHAIEVGEYFRGDPNMRLRPNIKNLINYIRKNITEYIKLDYRLYLFLVQNGYDVPLFLGIGHWANGKTPIELQVAVDKTKI